MNGTNPDVDRSLPNTNQQGNAIQWRASRAIPFGELCPSQTIHPAYRDFFHNAQHRYPRNFADLSCARLRCRAAQLAWLLFLTAPEFLDAARRFLCARKRPWVRPIGADAIGSSQDDWQSSRASALYPTKGRNALLQ